MILQSTFTTFFAILIAALISSTEGSESFGLRNFELPLNSDTFGTCTTSDDCARKGRCKSSENGCYCVKEDGDCDGTGKCKIIELISVRSCRQVCGCDGKTHCSSTVGNLGVNIKEWGPCAVETPIFADVIAAAE